MDEIRIYCSVEASLTQGVPPELVYAVSVVEGGRPGAVTFNKNGTRDLGMLQFNTEYLKTLESYGITGEDVQSRSCYPFSLAAWRIRGHLEEPGEADVFTKAAYYHSRSPKFNRRYSEKLKLAALKFDFEKAAGYLRRFYAQQAGQEERQAVEERSEKLKPVADDVTLAMIALNREWVVVGE